MLPCVHGNQREHVVTMVTEVTKVHFAIMELSWTPLQKYLEPIIYKAGPSVFV